MRLHYLYYSPILCAQAYTDVDIIDSIPQYARFLSMAHRVLDGNEEYQLPDELLNSNLYYYPYPHNNHQTWIGKNLENYRYTYDLLYYLISEWRYRFGWETHPCERVLAYLMDAPQNINTKSDQVQSLPQIGSFTDLSIPESRSIYKNRTSSYKQVWTRRDKPTWWDSCWSKIRGQEISRINI